MFLLHTATAVIGPSGGVVAAVYWLEQTRPVSGTWPCSSCSRHSLMLSRSYKQRLFWIPRVKWYYRDSVLIH